ncbi:hypothetical protein L1987_89299 [Smallanthus sonchifolius]|nr:hypothetical protein L1987_89299 [Smallanthus sonchifolius]
MTATNKIRRTTTSSPSSNRWGFIAADSVTACSVTASSTQPPGCKVAGIDLLGLESGFHSSPLTTLFGSALLRPVEGAANSSRKADQPVHSAEHKAQRGLLCSQEMKEAHH